MSITFESEVHPRDLLFLFILFFIFIFLLLFLLLLALECEDGPGPWSGVGEWFHPATPPGKVQFVLSDVVVQVS